MWASSYHDGIVWCNQLVVKLSVLLRDVAIRALSASEDSSRRGRGRGQSFSGDPPPEAAQGPPLPQEGANGPSLTPEAEGSLLASRAAMVMRRAEVALRGGNGRSLEDRLMIAKKGWGLDEVLEGADRKTCTGANLAWYQQYNTAKKVTKPLLQLKPSSVKVWGRSVGSGWEVVRR